MALKVQQYQILKAKDTRALGTSLLIIPELGALGVFHLPKDSGKFPKRRWEMLNGERRVSFDALVPFIPGSLHRPMYFPLKYKIVKHDDAKDRKRICCL